MQLQSLELLGPLVPKLHYTSEAYGELCKTQTPRLTFRLTESVPRRWISEICAFTDSHTHIFSWVVSRHEVHTSGYHCTWWCSCLRTKLACKVNVSGIRCMRPNRRNPHLLPTACTRLVPSSLHWSCIHQGVNITALPRFMNLMDPLYNLCGSPIDDNSW